MEEVLGFGEGRRWTARRDAVLREESGPRRKEALTSGLHSSARERRRAAYSFGMGRCWAVGLIWGWARRDPHAF
jgi:hypothetical protein